MTIAGFIARNALRNKRRFTLTVGSVAISLFLLTVLQVMLRGLTDPTATEHSAARLVVRHKVSLANMLHSKYKARIEAMPGVAACTKLTWFGGTYRDEKNFFPQFACDADALFEVLTEVKIAPEQRQRFIEERTACVVGAKTMERFGWKLGDRITLMGAMWPCDPELTIRGVFSGSLDDTMLFFHHTYFDELLGDKGFTGLFWVRAGNAAAVPELIERIDAAFENSDAETQTETERSFQAGFVSMLGNVKALIGSISTVIVFTLLLVTAGTMSMAIRERVSEVAVLKALGFESWHIFGLMLVESCGVALLGGLLGCLGAWLVLNTIDIQELSRGLFVSFEVTPAILARGILVAAAMGMVSCLLPAWRSVRKSVAEGLKMVE
jgi:putative ABC transport system permease protein